MKGLVVKEPWIDKILDGDKTWEIRGSNTKVRGTIALIKSGTGMIYGTVEIIDSHFIGPFDIVCNKDKHCIQNVTIINYDYPHAWVLRNPVKYDKPIPYNHPQGAVIWVNLPDVA